MNTGLRTQTFSIDGRQGRLLATGQQDSALFGPKNAQTSAEGTNPIGDLLRRGFEPGDHLSHAERIFAGGEATIKQLQNQPSMMQIDWHDLDPCRWRRG